jgi:hypothetical protein
MPLFVPASTKRRASAVPRLAISEQEQVVSTFLALVAELSFNTRLPVATAVRNLCTIFSFLSIELSPFARARWRGVVRASTATTTV